MEASFKIYRFNPSINKKYYYQDYTLNITSNTTKVLSALQIIRKKYDSTLVFRHSCHEGVCGSDGMNINGQNMLACITSIKDLEQPIRISPLPGLPVIRDLIVDMTLFFENYKKIKPYLIPSKKEFLQKERLQSPKNRKKLDGLYECIMCACCTTSCPSFWWNSEKFIGPAALLQSYRFIVDSRDNAKKERLNAMKDHYSVFKCRTIMSCTSVCPKKLNPSKAIGKIKTLMLKENL